MDKNSENHFLTRNNLDWRWFVRYQNKNITLVSMYHFFFWEKSVCPIICEVTFVENPQKSAYSRFTEDSARSKLYAFSLFLSCY